MSVKEIAELAVDLIFKLGMDRHIDLSLEFQRYSVARSYAEYQQILEKKKAEGYKDDWKKNVPKGEYVPWIDVIMSMLTHPESIDYSTHPAQFFYCPKDCVYCDWSYIDKHRKCKVPDGETLHLRFRSPRWTWAELMGSGGELYICLNRMEQVFFEKTSMS